MSEGQGSIRMPASSNQDQSQSNMAEPSREDYALMFELLWPYRDLFGTKEIFKAAVYDMALEFTRRKR